VTGGAANTGGATSSGGTRTGGTTSSGGTNALTGGTNGTTGGTTNAGGSTTLTGGSANTGGSTTLTGGSANTGGSTTLTGGTSAGGTITGGTGPGPSFYENSPFAGYAWTASSGTGTTITPANYDTKTPPGAPFCASGSVGAMSDYSGTAMVGINLNQVAGSTVVGTWTPPASSTGIIINVSNSGASTLRVQIQGPNGDTDANQRWCAPITQFNQDVTIPWTAFNTMCWDNTGTYYSDSKGPLEAVLVLVPGDATAAVPYNFCINKLALAGGGGGGTGGSGGGGSCTAAGTLQPTGTLTGTGWSAVRRDGVNYIVQSNVWGSGSAQQTISYNGDTFQVTQQTGNNSSSAGPVSYPSVFIGSNNSRNSSTAGLPRAVSSLGTIQTCVTHNGTGSTSGLYNAAFDIWFSTGSGGDSGNPSGGYVMLWLYKPSGAQPLGAIETSAATVGGMTVDVWYGTNNGRPCTSYVARSAMGTYSGNLAAFIQDAVSRNHVQSSWYLTNVFFGFEIWSGGVGLSLSNCSITLS
jgi:hypothetical protein